MNKRWAVLALAVVGIASPALAAAEADAATVEAGKALYSKKCAACHGADGVAKPAGKGSANFNDPAWQTKATDDAISDVITNGKNKMPKTAKLTAEQVHSLVVYVRTLSAK